jgi:hypothetical protein
MNPYFITTCNLMVIRLKRMESTSAVVRRLEIADDFSSPCLKKDNSSGYVLLCS